MRPFQREDKLRKHDEIQSKSHRAWRSKMKPIFCTKSGRKLGGNKDGKTAKFTFRFQMAEGELQNSRTYWIFGFWWRRASDAPWKCSHSHRTPPAPYKRGMERRAVDKREVRIMRKRVNKGVLWVAEGRKLFFHCVKKQEPRGARGGR